ncbi:MAG: type II secretion system F family protein [Alphaproteobacteria bacterium]|mgnify:CR=1 FL=1|jgi:tight adherence protein C|nr:type II secretion system F family protein [Rhodospirillaceae bacterium]MDG2482555.1 type II secretion system F family protein [Alphaproteobacteria bacterium]MBT6204143.1 type II secretion system F family protein [Rhodospirillaceae bacterium]MBT6512652.1 type II secretion system F family protein [Rhodospirillaceae bacterium]MBT7612153.1 type II secretion system F family protein [Rhodospirillaceae bacterium]
MINLQNIIIALSTLGAFLTIVAIAIPFLQTDNRGSRLKSMAKRREDLQAQQRQKLENSQETVSLRRRATRSQGVMTDVLNKFNMTEKARSPELRLKMQQAGWRGQGPAIAYVFARLALPFIMASVVAIIIISAKNVDLGTLERMGAAAAAAGLGYLIPGIMVANKAKKRQEMMIKGFPDALDLLVICVEAGISLEQGFVRVAQELRDISPILSEEFSITTAELAYLGDRSQALTNLAQRTGAEPIKALTTSLIQSEKYGTPLGVALRVLSRENRDARMARAEQKAGSLPAALTVPMILFFLPVLFIVLIGPAVIQVLATFAEN